MTKHTHGPWDIGLNPTIPEGQQIEAFSDDGNRVLQVIVRTFNPDDLHLIAASPDLLESLTALEAACTDEGVRGMGNLLEKARAAIAKATGEKE